MLSSASNDAKERRETRSKKLSVLEEQAKKIHSLVNEKLGVKVDTREKWIVDKESRQYEHAAEMPRSLGTIYDNFIKPKTTEKEKEKEKEEKKEPSKEYHKNFVEQPRNNNYDMGKEYDNNRNFNNNHNRNDRNNRNRGNYNKDQSGSKYVPQYARNAEEPKSQYVPPYNRKDEAPKKSEADLFPTICEKSQTTITAPAIFTVVGAWGKSLDFNKLKEQEYEQKQKKDLEEFQKKNEEEIENKDENEDENEDEWKS